MAKRRPTPENLSIIADELSSFLADFDPDDAEDAQLRTDALIASMIHAGVLEESRRIRNFRLHVALENVRLPIPDRAEIVGIAEMFHDLISSYGGEPAKEDMGEAKVLLERIANALDQAISVKMGKENLPLIDEQGKGSE